MDEERMERLREELSVYNMLAAVFLELPTVEGVRALLCSDEAAFDESESAQLLAKFVRENRERKAGDVLQDVARERVLLVRGPDPACITPPYESLYANAKQNEMIGSLNRFYGECGFKKNSDVHDAPDQIGVEFSFIATLLEKELKELEGGDENAADKTDKAIESFRSQHLARWASIYARQMIEAATLSYWQAVGHSILEVERLRA